MNNQVLKNYINLVLESDSSFLNVYNTYVEEEQQKEKERKEKERKEKERKEKERKEKERKESNVNMLVDPYAYYNYPEYSENNN